MFCDATVMIEHVCTFSKKINKAPIWATYLEQKWTQAPHLQAHYPSKLSMCISTLLPDLVWQKLTELPRGLPVPTNIAQARPILKHGTILLCWMEPGFYCILVFHRWEQHS